MYWESDTQHHVPHFHARYGENKAVFNMNGEIIAGSFPMAQEAYVKAWALIHHDELLADWELASNHEQLFKIEPLR